MFRTVKDIRDAIDGLPDDFPLRVKWWDAAGMHDQEPSVKVMGFELSEAAELCLVVDLVYSDGDLDDEDEVAWSPPKND